MRGINVKMLENKLFLDVTTKKRKQLINGELIRYSKTKSSRRRMAAQQLSLKMRNSGIVSDSKIGDSGENLSINLLYLMGAELSDENHDFSLLTKQTDKENIENPNIFDEYSFSKIENEKLNSIKSFSNVDDPFYCLDDDRPRNQKKEVNKKQSKNNRDKNNVRMENLITPMNKAFNKSKKDTNQPVPHNQKKKSKKSYKGDESKQKRAKQTVNANSKVNKKIKRKSQVRNLRNGKKALKTNFRLSV